MNKDLKPPPTLVFGKFPCQGKCRVATKGLPFSPEKGVILPCKMTEGADVSDTANISFAVVGADPCVRPGDVYCVYRTMRLIRDKRTFDTAHKNTFDIICRVPVPRACNARPYIIKIQTLFKRINFRFLIAVVEHHRNSQRNKAEPYALRS